MSMVDQFFNAYALDPIQHDIHVAVFTLQPTDDSLGSYAREIMAAKGQARSVDVLQGKSDQIAIRPFQGLLRSGDHAFVIND
jgi:hypothetical protein